MSNTRTIARNSVWYGLDSGISALVALITSIAIARSLGPAKNGYIVYVSYIASVVGSLGGIGIPATTRKYMAEFIGMGDRGTARFIYLRTLQIQCLLASLVTAAILFWVWSDSTNEYRWAAALIVLSIWPSMVNSISALANVATENLATNLPASLISTIVYFVSISLVVALQGGVTGIGASLFLMRAVDFLVRFIPTMKRIWPWEKAHLQPAGLRQRMIRFAWQGVITMIVSLIVWDRSEVILLKKFCTDIRQVAYYSIAFSMAEKLLLGSTIFAGAIGATIFAQYGRDKSRLPLIASFSVRYLALVSIPLHLIAVSLAVPALLLLYGHQYSGAATVAMLAPLLCLPKAFIDPATNLLQSCERQSFIIAATVLAGVVDVGVAWWLVSAHGAVGACIGSGVAQLTAVGIVWAAAIRIYRVRLPWRFLAKVIFVSLCASLAAHGVARQFVPLWGVLGGGGAAMIVFFALFYLLRVLEPEDGARLEALIQMLPGRIRDAAKMLETFLIRPTPVSNG